MRLYEFKQETLFKMLELLDAGAVWQMGEVGSAYANSSKNMKELRRLIDQGFEPTPNKE